MCVVSMIGDHYTQKWQPTWPMTGVGGLAPASPTKQEFDELKKEVLEMKELLIKAKIYDEKNNEPNCELEEKIKLLRKVAEAVGVSLDDILAK